MPTSSSNYDIKGVIRIKPKFIKLAKETNSTTTAKIVPTFAANLLENARKRTLIKKQTGRKLCFSFIKIYKSL